MNGYIGWTLFAVNYLAAGKTSQLARENETALKKRIFRETVDSAMRMKGVGQPQAGGDSIVFETDGGFYAALWNLAEELSCGLEADIRKVPVAQESVEVFEYFDMDPYMEPSKGTYIAATASPGDFAGYCERAGITAQIIGYLTKGPARIIKNAGRIRYLDRPAALKEVTEAEKES